MRIFITGLAGFIGFHAARRFSSLGYEIAGIDNLNDYYDPALKKARLAALPKGIEFQELDLVDQEGVRAALQAFKPDVVLHLAAQAGVRYSITNPFSYTQSNVTGHLSILEACRHLDGLSHLVYASSSSVYGGNTKVPFSEEDPVNHPVSLYAATKRSTELMSETYAHLYGLKQVGLRFFTVYGPWGRPDMAYWLFTDKIMERRPIEVFNHGKLERDFTFIDDIVDGIVATVTKPEAVFRDETLHRLYNLGNNQPTSLMDFISTLEEALGKDAEKIMKPMQAGDVYRTFADIDRANRDFGFQPKTTLKEGLSQFVDWYRGYYAV